MLQAARVCCSSIVYVYYSTHAKQPGACHKLKLSLSSSSTSFSFHSSSLFFLFSGEREREARLTQICMRSRKINWSSSSEKRGSKGVHVVVGISPPPIPPAATSIKVDERHVVGLSQVRNWLSSKEAECQDKSRLVRLPTHPSIHPSCAFIRRWYSHVCLILVIGTCSSFGYT